jgi:hypothetical protein
MAGDGAFPLQTVAVEGVAVAAGLWFTVTEKLEDTLPFPHELVPYTVKFPEVAPDAKLIVMLLLVPIIVAPVPLYDQL